MAWNQPPGHLPGYNPAYGGHHNYGQTHGYQQQNPYGPPPPASQYPPSHPGAWGGGGCPPPPPGVDPVLWEWFQTVDQDRTGKITATELRQALFNNNWSQFNPETCRLMIGMFDKDQSGTIDIYEFAALWKYIQQWKQCFDSFDRDRSGTIDANELQTAFTSFGYRLSPNFSTLCVRKFDRLNVHTMKFDDFIQCCVMLKSLTDAFRKHDHQQNGTVTISYEQFLEMVLGHTLTGI